MDNPPSRSICRVSVVVKFILVTSLIVAAATAGYLCRRRRWVPERMATVLMTWVVVAGYSIVGLLSVWKLPLKGTDFWLTTLAVTHVILATVAAMLLAPLLTRDSKERGAFAVTAGFGNNGFTLGGFVAYLLFPAVGLGLTAVYCLMAVPLTVLWFYPIARHYSGHGQGKPLTVLMRQSLLDWRSIGLVAAVVGIVFSPAVADVPFPSWIATAHVAEILMFVTAGMAYFAIGLRLRLSRAPAMARMIVSLALLRFGLTTVLGLGLLAIASLTPWPMTPLRQNVFMVLTIVPTAVTSVAVTNMFDLRPREASVLFVVNTLMYLLIVLPVVVWVYG